MLVLDDISVRLAGKLLLEGASARIPAGARVGDKPVVRHHEVPWGDSRDEIPRGRDRLLRTLGCQNDHALLSTRGLHDGERGE